MRFSSSLQNLPHVLQNLETIRVALHRQGNLSGWNQAQHLFARTRAIVPYRDGDLYNSAYVEKQEDTGEGVHVWIVGYHASEAPHVFVVHETPNRVHPTRGPSREPKQDHFLSEPRDAMVKTFPRTVADDFEAVIRKVRVR